jgi:transposase
MRGEDRTSGALFSYVDIEARIPAKHPLRTMRRLTNAALADLDLAFAALYQGIGRPSIAPERLLRAALLQLLYSIRSERQLVERLEFDMLFRWFVGLSIDETVFDASTFSKNRDRLLTHEIAQGFLSSLLGLEEVKGLLSGEHFSVDGTMLKAWASMKSFRPKSSSGEDPGTARASRRRRGAMARSTSARRSARTRRTPRRPTRTRAFTARATGRRAVFAISAMR